MQSAPWNVDSPIAEAGVARTQVHDDIVGGRGTFAGVSRSLFPPEGEPPLLAKRSF